MAKKEKSYKNSSSETLTAEEISEKYTVPELKYILRENGLKVSGKKQDLVERVLPILNEDVSNDS
ncbi:SAP domain-containing protein, partial [Methanobrevibacter sp.]|uniref:SAP domain-containing protein n=1 Tax=Methanobrevibacter sp. TaxID=66852 RepID=UPI0025F0FA8C